MREPVKRALFWLVLILALGTPVVAVEVALRGLGLGRPVLYYRDAAFRYAPVPDQRTVRRRGATVTIDSRGLRSVRDWTEPADAKVLFIGNSVTWSGTNIDDTESFPHQTCDHLAERLGGTFTCGNAGVNGYGTDNMVERLRYEEFEDEDVIVVVIVSGDAVRGLRDLSGYPFFAIPPAPPFRAVREASALAFALMASRLYGRDGPIRSQHEHLVASRSLGQLFAVLDTKVAQGRRVLLVLSPYEAELRGRERELTAHVRRTMASSGFPFLDLHDRMSDSSLPPSYLDGIHLEVTGHRVFGEAIADALVAILRADATGWADVQPNGRGSE